MSDTRTLIRSVRPGPVFIGVLAATIAAGYFCTTTGAERTTAGIGTAFIMVIGGWILSLCFHEFAHAATAFRFGDTSSEIRGYLSLDPQKYAHPGLSLALPLLFIAFGGVGFPGGAVYLNEQGMSRIQRSTISAAGPATNIVLAVILLLVIPTGEFVSEPSNFWSAMAMLAFLQITAAVLNLLPIPGFDGYGIIEPYLPSDLRESAAKVQPFGFLIILVLLVVPQLNRAFFAIIDDLFSLSGVSPELIARGYDLIIFWR